jgi:hypothetical protein
MIVALSAELPHLRADVPADLSEPEAAPRRTKPEDVVPVAAEPDAAAQRASSSRCRYVSASKLGRSVV